MLARAIPKSGEPLPAVGMGTWQTFDVGESAGERAPLAEVVRVFVDGGGRIIDSSPMYGRAEETCGALCAGLTPRPFLATKVWTRGQREGVAQMERSFRRLRTDVVDLMQVHNLVDWKTHLPLLREWKREGKIRYLGVTHYATSAFDELEQVMRAEAIDFVQLPYSVVTRQAESRLLPAARDTATAVLVMRPFEEGSLLSRVRDRPLPDVARELACTTWAQLCLKFILAHPAVHATLAATANPAHAREGIAAGDGPLPDAAQCRAIVKAVA